MDWGVNIAEFWRGGELQRGRSEGERRGSRHSGISRGGGSGGRLRVV